MFTKVLLCLAIATITSAEIPSYIKVCGRKNPNLNQCVLNSVTALRDTLRNGIPEFEVPSLEPLKLGTIILSDMPNFKLTATDVSVHGLSSYEVDNLHIDVEKHQIDFDVKFKKTRLDGTYKVDARILVPVEGTGPIHLSSDNVVAKIRLNYKLIKRNGKSYMYFDTMNLHLDLKDYEAKYDGATVNNTPLREAINQALGTNRKEILDATTPSLEKAISEFSLETANKICKHFTHDELFPDRE